MWHECNRKIHASFVIPGHWDDDNYYCRAGDFEGNLQEAIEHAVKNQRAVKPMKSFVLYEAELTKGS